MTARTGKYIIFCANYEAMQDAIGKVGEWFGQIDSVPNIYSVYSLDSSANKNFDDFRADEYNSHLGLLFCIDALNEGIHRDDSRWNAAFNYAKQYVENGGDINAMPDNYTLDGFKLTSWVRAQRERYKIKKLSQDRIEKLESIGMQWQLQAPAWDMNYQHAKEYFIEHGDLLVNLHYKCSDGFKLGAGICNQRTKYRTGKLSEDKIDKLEAIGMVWNTRDVSWDNGIDHARAYLAEHGNLKMPKDYVCDGGYNLANWLSTMRARYKKGTLDDEKVMVLESLGMQWSQLQKAWEKGFSHAKAYFDKHGNLDISTIYVCDDGYKLGQWKRSQLRQLTGGTIKSDRIEKLKQIGLSAV